MNIILVGCGKAGRALAAQLREEGHSITMIDTDPEKIRQITQNLDVMGIVGNGSSIAVLSEAGMMDADILIAVTGSDELNLLCCMFAKKAGQCHAIARVRNPLYSHELDFIRQQLGISTIMNPELSTAREISRLLRFPSASKVDTFAEGRVRLIKFELQDDCPLVKHALCEIPKMLNCSVLICAVERGQSIIIPDGNYTLYGGDVVSFLATQDQATTFFQKLHLPTRPVESALIVGGGTIGYYLARDLLTHNIPVRMIEQDAQRSRFLAAELPEAEIIHADGTDQQVLDAEGVSNAGSVVALTNMDEENILLAMYACRHSNAKVVAKVNRAEFDSLLEGISIGNIVYPREIVSDFVLTYVRAQQNEAGSNIKTMYRILDDRVEALEFTVTEKSPLTNVPLSALKLKKGMLVCCITRGEDVIIPSGKDCIHVGDLVIVVTLERGLHDITGILK